MRLVKRTPNLVQRLPRLPTTPNVTLLDRRKPKSHPWPHDNTTFTAQIYIRWCCIDPSNAPDLSGFGIEETLTCRTLMPGYPLLGEIFPQKYSLLDYLGESCYI